MAAKTETSDIAKEAKALAATMTHPLRDRIMTVIAVEPGIGSAEIAERIDAPVQSVRRQLKILIDSGMVCVQGHEVARGLTRLYYASAATPYIRDRHDAFVPTRQRRLIDVRVGTVVFDDLKRALVRPDYGSRPGRMMARVPGLVDEQAWREISELQYAVVDRMMEIVEAGHARLAESGEEGIALSAAALLMELPRPGGDDRASGDSESAAD